jgi:hypothetical protein
MIINKKFEFNFDISEPKQKNNIVLFYLSNQKKIVNNYITFPEAFSKNLVNVEEVNNKGVVRYLKVTNISDQKLLILDSEQIIGNGIKQNRVVDSTTLISEYTSVTLKVSCCEKNRWSPAVSNELMLSDSLYFSKGRINNFTDIYTKQKTDQFKIWEDISDKLKEFESKSFTGTTEDIYKKRRNNVEEIVGSFNPGPNDIGVAIAIGNCLVSLDLFLSNEMFKIYLPKLIRSIALDSFKKTGYKSFVKTKDVHKLLRLIDKSEKKIDKLNDGTLGQQIRFNSELVVGSCLYFEEKMIHFSGFLKDQVNIPQYKSKVA